MVIPRQIKGILFDSGDTLVRPRGGKWLPGPHFHGILANYGIKDLNWDRLDYGLEEGMKYLDNHHHLEIEELL